MSEYEIRELRTGDEASLLETFNFVFAAENPDFRPRTMAEWEWAFRANPAGFRVWLAVKEAQVVAQYAALPYRVLVEGSERHFAQIVDSMVHPEHRRGLKRPGMFVNTALPFFDEYGGEGRDLVHYGWPIEQAWRVGKTFLKYEAVRTQPFLVREVDPAATDFPSEVEVIERFDHQARWLYDRCVGEWPASTIRDDAFLNWRFTDNPHDSYVNFGVRDAEGVLRGYAVYKFGDWVLPNMGLVVDWLVPYDEPEVAELLLRAVQARAAADGAGVAATIFPEWAPWFAWIQERGFLVHPSHYFMVARNFERRYDMLWLRDHWWYQLADTDLV